MFNFSKTPQGLQEIQNRSPHLNARQRRVLLLIDSPDFDILSAELKQRLAPENILQQLQDLGFIQSKHSPESVQSDSTPFEVTSSHHPLLNSEILRPTKPHDLPSTTFTQPTVTGHAVLSLHFTEAQQLMTELLHCHCGLMAKPLSQKIQQAADNKSLKFCQIQWLTALQESRMPPQDLQRSLQQLNNYLKH